MIHFPQDLESKYRFITLAAQRCDQLIRGAKPRVESRARKPTTLALQEVMAGVVEERGPEEVAQEELLAQEGADGSPEPAATGVDTPVPATEMAAGAAGASAAPASVD